MLAATHSLNPFRLSVSNPAGLEAQLLQRLVDCFDHSYRKMAVRFNPQAPVQVRLEVGDLANPGETTGSLIRISAAWMRSNPHDIDVMTHEQFHVVQDYGVGAQPGWAIEGLADYARWKYGLSNAGWALPAFRPEHHWTQGYGVTAAFFRWLEEQRRAGFPEELDRSLRSRGYGAAFWTSRFGSTLEQLWRDFAHDQQGAFEVVPFDNNAIPTGIGSVPVCSQ